MVKDNTRVLNCENIFVSTVQARIELDDFANERALIGAGFRPIHALSVLVLAVLKKGVDAESSVIELTDICSSSLSMWIMIAVARDLAAQRGAVVRAIEAA